MSLRAAWATSWVVGQSVLQSETLTPNAVWVLEQPSACRVDGRRVLFPLSEAAHTPYPWSLAPCVDFSLSP